MIRKPLEIRTKSAEKNSSFTNRTKAPMKLVKTLKDNTEELRIKYIEQAKKYLGTPYRQKYFTPDDPRYHAPLFLDCCGLVRKAVNDLKDDFGFTLQNWNQSYQFDILPLTIPFEKMKPGDLIFYEGKYVDKTRKRIHMLTHVEIFLGGETGEQTIASRWRTGTVSFFDSYKFEPTSWYDVKYHYKSIDTWLKGICRSFCSEHPWKMPPPPKKKLPPSREGDNAPKQDQESRVTPLPNDASRTESRRRERNVVARQGNENKIIQNPNENTIKAPRPKKLPQNNKLPVIKAPCKKV